MQQTNVVVGIGPAANNFTPGTYTGTLTFQNLTSGVGNTSRNITLVVNTVGGSTMKVTPTSSFVYSGPQGGPFGFNA